MNRQKRLTKREQKALRGPRPGSKTNDEAPHIHCIACGRHLDTAAFEAEPPAAEYIRCRHHSSFPTCVDCIPKSRELLEIHDRTGNPVQHAAAWH